MKWFVIVFLWASAFFVTNGFAQDIVFSRQTLSINGFTMDVEVAETSQQRQQGLMYRKYLNEQQGMLFKFGSNDLTPCFWMKNTYIPLSIAFINKDGIILQIEQLSPQSTHLACSEYPIRFALEVSQGWFFQHDIEIGAQVEGINRP